VVERWAGVRPRAGRADPLLGPAPGRAGVFVATGGFRTAFATAPVVAELLADLVVGAPADLPPELSIAAHLEAAATRSARRRGAGAMSLAPGTPTAICGGI
jgi:glycine/D-amino acid oxidase-like deaminating enzyme